MRNYILLLLSFFVTVKVANAQSKWAGWIGGSLSAGPVFGQQQNANYKNTLGIQLSGNANFPLYFQRLRWSLGTSAERVYSFKDQTFSEGILNKTNVFFIMPESNVEYCFRTGFHNLQIISGAGISIRIKAQETNHWKTYKSKKYPVIWRNETVLFPLIFKLTKAGGNKKLFFGSGVYFFHKTDKPIHKGWKTNSLHLNFGICWYPLPAVHKARGMGR